MVKEPRLTIFYLIFHGSIEKEKYRKISSPQKNYKLAISSRYFRLPSNFNNFVPIVTDAFPSIISKHDRYLTHLSGMYRSSIGDLSGIYRGCIGDVSEKAERWWKSERRKCGTKKRRSPWDIEKFLKKSFKKIVPFQIIVVPLERKSSFISI